MAAAPRKEGDLVNVSCSPFGCLGVVLALVALWALAFGFTWNGEKHEVSCSCDRGVVVQ